MRVRSGQSVLAAIAAATLFVLGALWAAGLHYMQADRSLAIAAAERETANLSLSLAEQNSRALRNVEEGLRSFVRDLDPASGHPTEPRLHWADSRVVSRMIFVDARGRVSWEGRGAVDMSDREYFRWHRDRASTAIHIGAPVQSRLIGEWIIPVSLRVESPGGGFAGVAVAAVRPEYFIELYSKAEVGPDGCVTLVGVDGIVRAQRRGGIGSFGTGMQDSPLLPLQAHALAGQYVSAPDAAGIVRHVSFRTLAEYPGLVVAVGRAEGEVLADHEKRVRVEIAMLVLASGIALLVAAVVWMAARRQRLAMIALKRSEERYRDIYENAVEGIFQTTPEGRYLSANPAMARIAGYATPADLIRNTNDVANGYLDPRRRAAFQAQIEIAGRVADFEYELVRADGSTTWVSENARAVRDEDGNLLRYEGFLTDISARKHEEHLKQEAAELALRRYQALLERLRSLAAALKAAEDLPSIYRSVLDFARLSAPVSGMYVSVFDAERGERRRVFAWSDGREEDVGGLPPIGLTGSAHSRALATGEVVVTSEDRDAAHAQGSSLVVPMRAMGSVIGAIELASAEPAAYKEEHVAALRAAAPVVGLAIQNARLLMDERQHRRRAEHAEQRNAAVLQSALDAIVTIDHEDHVLDFNAAAERLFGVPQAEVLGKRLADAIIPPELRARHQAALARFVHTGEATMLNGRVEMTAQRRDGEIFPVELSVVRIPGSAPPVFTGFIRDITERKRAEAALREGEARYRKTADELGALLDGSVDAICTFDREGRFVRVSAASRLIWGLAPEELVGTDGMALIVPEDRERTRAAMEVVIAGSPTRAFENRNVRRDGSVAHIMWSAHWREHDQTMFCVARDVTEGKLMAEANRHLADRLRETLENLASGFVTVDAHWRLTYVNREAARMAGRPREALVGEPLFEQIPSLLGTPFEAAYRRAMAERVPVQLEEYLQPYGRWLEMRVYPTSDPGLAIYFHDVTERRRAVEMLAESERRFEHVATATSDAIYDWDVASGRVWRSVGMTKLFGHEPEALDSRLEAWTSMLHPEDRERVMASMQEALASGASRWSAEYRFLRQDGTYAIVHDGASIMRDAAGRAYRVVGGMSDVTERRELERQLVRAQRLESLGTLAGGIAHDLNNILTPIMMGVNLLEGEDLDEERRTVVETIRLSANRGAEMVRQVLSFARGMEGERVEVQPRHVMDEVERMIRDTFPRNVRVAMRADQHLPPVMGDPTQLHQVLLNLCLNARDAMPEGGELTVTAREVQVAAPAASVGGEVPAGRYVAIDVQDTGSGMADAVLDRIFDPFFTTKPPGEGTGLGLPTTLAIVRRHRGHIQVQSRVGQGSRFRVVLPVSCPDPAPAAETPLQRAHEPTGQTIMVVDDEASIRALAAQALASAGYRVLIASNGMEALAAYREASRVDLVVTDMMMPVMGGEALVQALGEVDPGMPIVCASGIRGASVEADGAVFLAKPYTVEALVATVQQALA